MQHTQQSNKKKLEKKYEQLPIAHFYGKDKYVE